MPNEAEKRFVNISVDHVINVRVGSARQEMGFNPDTRVASHDRVRWVCDAGDLEIQFENEGPFEPQASVLRIPKGPNEDWFKIRRGTNSRRFKYTVTIRPSDGKPSVVEDPVIIVEDG